MRRLLTAEEVKRALPAWLRQRDLAELTGINAETIRTRIKRGQIPARKFGGNKVVWIADLERETPDLWDALVAKIERSHARTAGAHTAAERGLPFEMTLSALAKATGLDVRRLRFEAERGTLPTRPLGKGKRPRRIVLLDEVRECRTAIATVVWRALTEGTAADGDDGDDGDAAWDESGST